jgi:glucose/arabinose dehydrogenase
VRYVTLTAAIAAASLALAPGLAGAAPNKRLLKADFPAAMAAWPSGGLVYGELGTGRIWRVTATGHRGSKPLAQVRVSTDGLKGLLGLAVDAHGAVFAAYTTKTNQHLVVDRVFPGNRIRVWLGPTAGDEANGGRLAFAHDGRLLVVTGDRDRSIRVNRTGDPIVPTWPGFGGEILSLDPAGPRAQTPVVLSHGFFNPFGLAVTPSGAVWATDNSIGDDEHLFRGDQAPATAPAVKLPQVAPAGLAVIGENDLYVCGFSSGRLDHYRVGADGRPKRAGRVAGACQIGVTLLVDGRLAYANQNEIRVLAP